MNNDPLCKACEMPMYVGLGTQPPVCQNGQCPRYVPPEKDRHKPNPGPYTPTSKHHPNDFVNISIDGGGYTVYRNRGVWSVCTQCTWSTNTKTDTCGYCGGKTYQSAALPSQLEWARAVLELDSVKCRCGIYNSALNATCAGCDGVL